MLNVSKFRLKKTLMSLPRLMLNFSNCWTNSIESPLKQSKTPYELLVFDWDGEAEDLDMLNDVDSTGTESITATKSLEIVLAVLAGNTTYVSADRTLTVYGRDGITVLWTVKISNSVYGTRTDSTKG